MKLAAGRGVTRIRNARAPACLLEGALHAADGFVSIDLTIREGVIAELSPASGPGASADVASSEGEPAADLDQGLILPGFVDIHTHLDKGQIWARTPNPDGTFPGALAAVAADRAAHWNADDLRARMHFNVACAHAHGTVALRTHIDSVREQTAITWPVFREIQEEWRGRMTLEASPLFGLDQLFTEGHLDAVLAQVLRSGSGLLGCVTTMDPRLEAGLDIMFHAALEHGLDLDFHVDETMDPAAHSLASIADAALRHGFKGKILCGHCCSLSQQGEADSAATIAKVRDAGLAIVSLPMCNLYLQDRAPGRTPRQRGVTLLHELRAAGVPVMVASDNTRDPFYAYGDLDMVEVLREATRVLHLDHPFGDWAHAATEGPAAIMRAPANPRIAVGAPADLLLFSARTWTEFFARPQSDRVVLRKGVAIDTAPPDYRELDRLDGVAP